MNPKTARILLLSSLLLSLHASAEEKKYPTGGVLSTPEELKNVKSIKEINLENIRTFGEDSGEQESNPKPGPSPRPTP